MSPFPLPAIVREMKCRLDEDPSESNTYDKQEEGRGGGGREC